MILRRLGSDLLIVLQTDHARQCADFARRWGSEACQRPDPLGALVKAAAEHDNGWAEWEAAPSLDLESGQPWQFVDLPVEQHLALYRRGIERAATDDPYAGLLVSLHGAGLYNDRFGTWPRPTARRLTVEQQGLVAEYLKEQEVLRRQLQSDAARDPRYLAAVEESAMWRSYKLLQVWDRLSLQFCYRGCASGEISPAPCRAGAPDEVLACLGDERHTLRLAPYPFDESPVALPVAARVVPNRRYRSTEEFVAAYQAAEEIELPYRAVA